MDKSLLETMKVLAVSEGDLTTIQNIKDAENPKEKDCPPELKNDKPELVLIDKKEEKLSPWKFSVRSTLTGPKGKLEKNFLNADQTPELKSRLDNIIKSNFISYEDRMKSVAESCSGLSQYQRISMASMLAGRLSNIYDYSRANGGSDAVIMPEEQWQALKSGTAKGVCRDASLTVSQFLLACGFRKDQVAIKSYRTEDSGHQVTSIKTPDGEYTINWDELYKTSIPGAPEPNIPNTGIYYTEFDPETGKMIVQKRTELADALKLLAG